MNLLHIDSSISGDGFSRQLSTAIVAALTRVVPGLDVIRRDLDADPIPHLDSKYLLAVRPSAATDGVSGVGDHRGAEALSEFLAADIVVIGAPMYNFTVPSQLKAWIDRIIAGETGAVGLAGSKRVIIASSRGGLDAPGMPFEANDFQGGTCVPSSRSSASTTSESSVPRVSPSDPSGARRRYAPPWPPLPRLVTRRAA